MILGGFCPLLPMREYNIYFQNNRIELFTPFSEEPFYYVDIELLIDDLGFLFESEVLEYETES